MRWRSPTKRRGWWSASLEPQSPNPANSVDVHSRRRKAARPHHARRRRSLMAKAKTLYSCTECGGQAPKWQGQCPHCGVWNTLVETVAATAPARFESVTGARSSVTPLSAVKASPTSRIPTGLEEFDRVLGG